MRPALNWGGTGKSTIGINHPVAGSFLGGDLRIHVSADEPFELFVDGHRIARGPDRSDVQHWCYATHALADAESELNGKGVNPSMVHLYPCC